MEWEQIKDRKNYTNPTAWFVSVGVLATMKWMETTKKKGLYIPE